MNSNPSRYVLGLRIFANGGYLIAHGLVCMTCAWYLVNFFGFSHNWSRAMVICFAFPEIFLVIIPVVVPALREYVFTFIDGLEYTPQMPGMFFVSLSGYIYLGIILYMMIICHKQLSREQNDALVMLVILATICAIAENLIIPTQRISPFFETVAIYLFLISVDNQNWVYNNMTNTYNRLTFQRYVENWFRNGTSFDIVIISMDRKTYFHSLSMETEYFQRLMVSLGNFFKGLKGNPDVYYCERGIFLIPVFRDSGINVSKMVDEIEARFSKPWSMGDPQNLEYKKLPIRLICAEVPDSVDSIDKLFKLIDVPYDADSDEPLLVNTAAQVGLFLNQVEAMEGKNGADDDVKTTTELPRELAVMLDGFSSHISELMPAERRIVLYYLDGYEIADIPDAAGITINTVRKHNKNIYRKLQIGSKEELMMYLDVMDRCGRLDPIEHVLRESADHGRTESEPEGTNGGGTERQKVIITEDSEVVREDISTVKQRA
ncbi:MAG: helix-turn-helix transcriptional regulator [Bilifractor sp.]